jgi:hypothetical protein
MEEKRGEESPEFAALDDGAVIERAEPVQRYWIGRCAPPKFEENTATLRRMKIRTAGEPRSRRCRSCCVMSASIS